MFAEWQIRLLREFCSRCYWYGEETGDYDMKNTEFDELLKEFQDDWVSGYYEHINDPNIIWDDNTINPS